MVWTGLSETLFSVCELGNISNGQVALSSHEFSERLLEQSNTLSQFRPLCNRAPLSAACLSCCFCLAAGGGVRRMFPRGVNLGWLHISCISSKIRTSNSPLQDFTSLSVFFCSAEVKMNSFQQQKNTSEQMNKLKITLQQ